MPDGKDTVLVTGAAGFIGSHLVEQLLEKQYKVVCLIMPGEDTRWLKNRDVQIKEGDLTNKSTLYEPLKGVSMVFHLAAKMGGGDQAETIYRVNTQGSRNLIDACLESGINLKRFLFVSSIAAMGDSGEDRILDEDVTPKPFTDYGKSKIQTEEFLKQSRLPYSIVRLPLVYGPRSFRGLYSIFKITNKGFQLQVGNSSTNLGYVKDIVRAMVLVAESESSRGETFILGEDRPYTLKEISSQVAAALDKHPVALHVPYALMYSIVFLLETFSDWLGKKPMLRRDSIASYLKLNWRASSRKIMVKMGFHIQYPLPVGLEETARWYKQNGYLK